MRTYAISEATIFFKKAQKVEGEAMTGIERDMEDTEEGNILYESANIDSKWS